jgi:hypothetical protein
MPLIPKFPPDYDIAGNADLLYNIACDAKLPAEIKKNPQNSGNRTPISRILTVASANIVGDMWRMTWKHEKDSRL